MTKICSSCLTEIKEDEWFLEYGGPIFCQKCTGWCRSCDEYYPYYEIIDIGGRPICKNCEKEMFSSESQDTRTPTPISNIKAGMKYITVKGKVRHINKINVFTRKDGTKGRVGSFVLSDATGTIRVVLWDFQCSILEMHDFTQGTPVTIKNGYSKENQYKGKIEIELHVGRYSEIELY